MHCGFTSFGGKIANGPKQIHTSHGIGDMEKRQSTADVREAVHRINELAAAGQRLLHTLSSISDRSQGFFAIFGFHFRGSRIII